MSTKRPIVDEIMANLLDDSTYENGFKVHGRNNTTSLKPPFVFAVMFIQYIKVSAPRYDVQDLVHILLKWSILN